MKRFVYGVIALTLAASLCGCGKVKDEGNVNPNDALIVEAEQKKETLKVGCLAENAASEEEYANIINEIKNYEYELLSNKDEYSELLAEPSGDFRSGDKPSGDRPSGDVPSGEGFEMNGPDMSAMPDGIEINSVEDLPVVDITYYDNLNTALLALDKGDIEVLSLYENVCKYIANKNPGKYKSIPVMTQGAFSMATLDTNKELVEKINTAIDALKNDGTIAKLSQKYIEGNEAEEITLPKIEGAATYRVVVTGDLPPMDYITADGKAEGFNIALLAEISKKAGINFEIVSADSGSRAVMITSGKADIMFWTKGLKKSIKEDFSYEYDLPDGLMETHVYHEERLGILAAEK